MKAIYLGTEILKCGPRDGLGMSCEKLLIPLLSQYTFAVWNGCIKLIGNSVDVIAVLTASGLESPDDRRPSIGRPLTLSIPERPKHPFKEETTAFRNVRISLQNVHATCGVRFLRLCDSPRWVWGDDEGFLEFGQCQLSLWFLRGESEFPLSLKEEFGRFRILKLFYSSALRNQRLNTKTQIYFGNKTQACSSMSKIDIKLLSFTIMQEINMKAVAS
ncbi:hypothetical protein AVEN_253530-1 [Araneus ventricosus]|uniref:Uncharacterized protein n=1 Tax=Araneus ventricosus TaxID=182803 RepID=A0A4Y2BSK2_ARAVE|nr:hypothetical protein AVEN_253530-1 [Araneus ventricosus]